MIDIFWRAGQWVTECLENVKRNTFSSTVADKLVFLIQSDEITICFLQNVLFIRCFKFICTARVIDCKHQPQWRLKQIIWHIMWNCYMRKRFNQNCSVVPEKFQPSCQPFNGKLGKPRKPRFPLERNTIGLGFSHPHWPPMMDSIYFTYPYQPMGKIKNEQLHVSHTLAARQSVTSLLCSNNVTMLYLGLIRIFLRSFSCFFCIYS